jgi:hypothetical protein
MADAKAETPETSQDLTIFVQNLLEQMVLQFSSPFLILFQQNRFNQMSTTIIGRSKFIQTICLME